MTNCLHCGKEMDIVEESVIVQMYINDSDMSDEEKEAHPHSFQYSESEIMRYYQSFHIPSLCPECVNELISHLEEFINLREE